MKYTKADLLAALKNFNNVEMIEEDESDHNSILLRIHKRIFLLGFGDANEPHDVNDTANMKSLVTSDFSLSGVYKSKEIESGALDLLNTLRIVNRVNIMSDFPAIINHREGSSLFEVEVRHFSYVNAKNNSISASEEKQFYLHGAILLMSMTNLTAMQQLQSEIDLYIADPDVYIKKCTGK